MLSSDSHISPAFLRQASVHSEVAVLDVLEARADANADTSRADPYVLSHSNFGSGWQKGNYRPEGEMAEMRDRDEEIRALREVTTVLTERLERMTEMLGDRSETRSEAAPPSYFTGTSAG